MRTTSFSCFAFFSATLALGGVASALGGVRWGDRFGYASSRRVLHRTLSGPDGSTDDPARDPHGLAERASSRALA
jgi:hypothetical protein